MKQKRTKKDLAFLKEAYKEQMRVKAEIQRLAKKFPEGILKAAPSEDEARRQRKELLKEVTFLKPYAEMGAKFYKDDPTKQTRPLKKRSPNIEKIDRAKSIIEREKPTKLHFSSCRCLANFLTTHSKVGDKFTKDWVNTHLKSFIKK